MSRNIILALLLISTVSLFAQREANMWYFGRNCAMDFNSGAPVVLTNSAMNAFEGCASIADPNTGALLFYTDGLNVWDASHTLMANGTGLLGSGSSTQSGIITPKPNDPNTYYVFAVGVNWGGLSYSEIDLTLNGGLGDVTANKNIPLLANASEKITAVSHSNKRDIWVITNEENTDAYHAYEITPAGVNTVSVVSNTGPVINSATLSSFLGYMRGSIQGDKIAAAHRSYSIELMDFDASTGILSNSTSLIPYSASALYGIEFSPNGQLLYATEESSRILYQYDISSGVAATMNASRITIESAMGFSGGAIQNGPDGKTYVSRSGGDSIGIIEFPDVYGLGCNYRNDGLWMEGNTLSYGLPTFISTIFNINASFSFSPTCFGDSTEFIASTSADTIIWNFDDPATGIFNSSDTTRVKHVFSAPGKYDVSLIVYQNGQVDTFYNEVQIFEVPNVDLGKDLKLCFGESAELSAYQPITGVTYLWNDSTMSATKTITETGTYYVRAQVDVCEDWDTIFVELFDEPFSDFELKIEEELPLCFGDTVILNGYHPSTISYAWQDSSITDSVFTVSSPGTYYVELTDTCGTYLFPITIDYVLCDTPTICNTVVAPSAFSPNRDGLNDYFRARTLCPVTEYRMEVYNRWGQMVYDTESLSEKGWNGRFNNKESEIGEYVWYLSFIDKDDFSYTEKGVVTLIR